MSQIQLIERSMPIKTQPYRAKRRQPRKCTGAIFHSKAVMQQMWVTKKWRRFSMGFLNCQGHRLRTKIFEQDLKKRCGSSGFSCANKQTFLTKELFNASSKDFGCRCGVELVGPLFVHFSNPVLNVHKIAAHELWTRSLLGGVVQNPTFSPNRDSTNSMDWQALCFPGFWVPILHQPELSWVWKGFGRYEAQCGGSRFCQRMALRRIGCLTSVRAFQREQPSKPFPLHYTNWLTGILIMA